VWVAAGYLIYRSANLVFGRSIGVGTWLPVLVAAVSAIGTAVAVGACGRNLVAHTPAPGGPGRGALFSLWLLRAFLLVVLASFLVWDIHALSVGVAVALPSSGSGLRALVIVAFLGYCVVMGFNARRWADPAAVRGGAEGAG
jgi:hypothetical protein